MWPYVKRNQVGALGAVLFAMSAGAGLAIWLGLPWWLLAPIPFLVYVLLLHAEHDNALTWNATATAFVFALTWFIGIAVVDILSGIVRQAPVLVGTIIVSLAVLIRVLRRDPNRRDRGRV